MTAIKIPSRNRDRVVLIDLDDMYEIAAMASNNTTLDRRTKEGRAYVDGVWSFLHAAHEFAGEEAP